MEVTSVETLAMLPRVAVFYDDEVGTIEPHMAEAKALGVFPVVAKGVPELFRLMKRFGNRAAFFLDMHVPGERNLGAVQCQEIETDNGSAFGTAAYRAFLKLYPGNPIRYANILSGRPIDAAAYQVLSELEDYGFVIEDIDKANKEEFREALHRYVDGTSADATGGQLNIGSLGGDEIERIDAFESILKELIPEASDELLALLLGFPREEARDIGYIKALAAENLARGESSIRSRLDFIAYIHSGLGRILGEKNLSAQRTWLRSPNDFFEGKTPAVMLASQDINDLALVAAAISRVLR